MTQLEEPSCRRKATPIILDEAERSALSSLANSRSLPHGVVRRAQPPLLACADGEAGNAITTHDEQEHGSHGASARAGLLHDHARAATTTNASRRSSGTALRSQPSGATHWTTRSMSKHCGVSKSTVQRWFDLFGVQPHRQRTSSCPTIRFSREGARTIVGLYLNPPDHAVVLCVRRKNPGAGAAAHPTPVAPGARLRRGRHARLHPTRHDHAVRRAGRGHGRSAQSMQTPSPTSGIPGFSAPHRPQRAPGVGRASGGGQLRHAQTRQGESVAGAAASLPIHYTPTYASWLNQVERWFGIITQRAIRRGSFSSVKQLTDINRFVRRLQHQDTPVRLDRHRRFDPRQSGRLSTLISGTAH